MYAKNMLKLNSKLVRINVRSQVVQETNFRFLKAFLEKFSVLFPTAKELEVILAMFVQLEKFWLFVMPPQPESLPLLTCQMALCSTAVDHVLVNSMDAKSDMVKAWPQNMHACW